MLYLQKLQEKDVDGFYQWILDYEVTKYSLSSFQQLKNKQSIDLWYKSVLKDTKNINLGIYLSQSDRCIGYAGLTSISTTNKSAEYFIFIGDKSAWGKGFGTQVTQKILEYGFTTLNLNRIMLTVSEPNIGGVKAYLNAGFIKEGVLRQACFRDGGFHDKIVMSVLKSEYFK